MVPEPHEEQNFLCHPAQEERADPRAQQRPGRKARGITADQTIVLGKMIVTTPTTWMQRPLPNCTKSAGRSSCFSNGSRVSSRFKTFLGTSRNGVLTQIWIAPLVYLFLAFLKFRARLGSFLQQMLRLLQLNLFERRNLIKLFKPPEKKPVVYSQILLFYAYCEQEHKSKCNSFVLC